MTVAAVPSSYWPSPSRSQARDAMEPPTSVEVSVKVTTSPTGGVALLTVKLAVGGLLTGGGASWTVIALLAVAGAALLSVTWSRTVTEPAAE